jgi:hypothetical protein
VAQSSGAKLRRIIGIKVQIDAAISITTGTLSGTFPFRAELAVNSPEGEEKC